jgi:hypothetical protein
MKEFIWNIKEFGIRIAIVNLLLGLVKKISGATKIHLTYPRKKK